MFCNNSFKYLFSCTLGLLFCLNLCAQTESRPNVILIVSDDQSSQPKAKWRDIYQDLESPRREYAGFVSTMDENILRLLETLEAEGLRENTIVLFLSDHGHSVEQRAFGGGGYAGDLRGAKTSLFEGGIRVPFVVSWPGKLAQGEVRDQFCMSMDLLPTLARWCGVDDLPRGLEGKAQNDVFESNAASSRENARILEYQLPLGAKVKYVKVIAKNIGKNPDWHQAPFADAFLFIDEIILK